MNVNILPMAAVAFQITGGMNSNKFNPKGTNEPNPAGHEIKGNHLADGLYPIKNIDGKVNGMHMMGAELRGEAQGGQLSFFHDKENEPCVSITFRAAYSREGFRPNCICAQQVPSDDPGKNIYEGYNNDVFIFEDDV